MHGARRPPKHWRDSGSPRGTRRTVSRWPAAGQRGSAGSLAGAVLGPISNRRIATTPEPDTTSRASDGRSVILDRCLPNLPRRTRRDRTPSLRASEKFILQDLAFSLSRPRSHPVVDRRESPRDATVVPHTPTRGRDKRRFGGAIIDLTALETPPRWLEHRPEVAKSTGPPRWSIDLGALETSPSRIEHRPEVPYFFTPTRRFATRGNHPHRVEPAGPARGTRPGATISTEFCAARDCDPHRGHPRAPGRGWHGRTALDVVSRGRSSA